ncbi:MAG: hypothetical protein QW587_01705 [Candidatus Bathyarchaeia archaeon]
MAEKAEDAYNLVWETLGRRRLQFRLYASNELKALVSLSQAPSFLSGREAVDEGVHSPEALGCA